MKNEAKQNLRKVIHNGEMIVCRVPDTDQWAGWRERDAIVRHGEHVATWSTFARRWMEPGVWRDVDNGPELDALPLVR